MYLEAREQRQLREMQKRQLEAQSEAQGKTEADPVELANAIPEASPLCVIGNDVGACRKNS